MSTEIDQPAPTGSDPRRGRRIAAAVVGAFVAGALSAGGGAVWAAHQFPDVPPTSPFHGDVDWLVDNGITSGYGDGTFKPTKAVTRQELAAFLHRYNDSIEIVNGPLVDPVVPDTSWYVSATCPAGKRAIAGQGLTLDARLVMVSSSTTTSAKWQVHWTSRTGATINPGGMIVSATCAPA